MKKHQVFELLAKGQDYDSHKAYFASIEEAEKAKPFAGGYGGKIETQTITIFDTAEEWDPTTNTEAIESGMSKLTDQEKAALGLSPKSN